MSKWTCLLLCLFLYGLINGQGNPVCPAYTTEELKTNFEPGTENYHEYRLQTKICDKSDGAYCSADFIFALLKTSLEFAAPTTDRLPAENCCKVFLEDDETMRWNSLVKCEGMSVWDKYMAFTGANGGAFMGDQSIWTSIGVKLMNEYLGKGEGTGHIVNKLNPQNRTIINYTFKDHILRWGKVERKITETAGAVYIATTGTGNNLEIPGLDNLFKKLNNCVYVMEDVWAPVNRRLADFYKKYTASMERATNVAAFTTNLFGKPAFIPRCILKKITNLKSGHEEIVDYNARRQVRKITSRLNNEIVGEHAVTYNTSDRIEEVTITDGPDKTKIKLAYKANCVSDVWYQSDDISDDVVDRTLHFTFLLQPSGDIRFAADIKFRPGLGRTDRIEGMATFDDDQSVQSIITQVLAGTGKNGSLIATRFYNECGNIVLNPLNALGDMKYLYFTGESLGLFAGKYMAKESTTTDTGNISGEASGIKVEVIQKNSFGYPVRIRVHNAEDTPGEYQFDYDEF